MTKTAIILIILCTISTNLFGQNGVVNGLILSETTQKPVEEAQIVLENTLYGAFSNKEGKFRIKNVKFGIYNLLVLGLGLKSSSKTITVSSENLTVEISLFPLENNIGEVEILGQNDNNFGITRLKSIEGTAINESKKTEVILLKDITANTATNNARQIFAKVPGLNIWENDAAGVQLSIGARGLSPNRSSNFNFRQNGYDISAEPIGYPESYYTPPTEALEKIEIIRGAASLQYGPQFGGMVNFVMKKGTKIKPIEVLTRQTIGSFGFFNSFNSIGGTKGRLNYFAFFQHKQGDSWRSNSGFKLDMGFVNVNFRINERLKIGLDVTIMNNLAQQAGGLNDFYFKENARQSRRDRNWFKVNWFLASFYADWNLGANTKLNSRFFLNNSERISLGNLERINRPDDISKPRTLIWDQFLNMGNETRLLHSYEIGKTKSAFLTGFRLFRGATLSRQGNGSNGNNADFQYVNPQNLEGSSYQFANYNFAAFAENVFFISPKFSVTPGLRYEYIETNSNGYFNQNVVNGAGTTIVQNKIFEDKNYPRQFALFGIGGSYKPNDRLELYINMSQNYRAVTYSDIRIRNPNFRIDPNIKDENGFNADLGFRGNVNQYLNFDISSFYLQYEDRIGSDLRIDDNTGLEYRYQTNISDSRAIGLEAFAEIDLLKLLKPSDTHFSLSYFANFSIIDARYINSANTAVVNKYVEEVPRYMFRNGISFKYQDFSATVQTSNVGDQFSEATNSEAVFANFGTSASGVIGKVPAYFVADFSVKYNYKWLILGAGINNFTNSLYFTRRATSYPGPGILPSDPRSFYLTIGGKF
ncbi:MAG: TonB-dependent receptor domain-containing protein [Cytophagales bacterium]